MVGISIFCLVLNILHKQNKDVYFWAFQRKRMSVWRLSALALCLKSSVKHLAKSWSPGASWSRIEGLDPGSRAFAAAPWPSPPPPPGPSLTGAGSRRDPGGFTWSDGRNQYLNHSNVDPTLWILASSATLNPEWLGGAFSLFLQSDIICCSWYSRSRAAARLVICYLLFFVHDILSRDLWAGTWKLTWLHHSRCPAPQGWIEPPGLGLIKFHTQDWCIFLYVFNVCFGKFPAESCTWKKWKWNFHLKRFCISLLQLLVCSNQSLCIHLRFTFISKFSPKCCHFSFMPSVFESFYRLWVAPGGGASVDTDEENKEHCC